MYKIKTTPPPMWAWAERYIITTSVICLKQNKHLHNYIKY